MFTFATDAFTTSTTQISVRDAFFAWFSADSADYNVIYNISYNPRFTSLSFILEILVQLRSQISDEFTYTQFNAVTGKVEKI